MPQGKSVSKEVQWIVVYLAMAMSIEEVEMHADLSKSKMKNILARFQQVGNVKGCKSSKPKLHWTFCDYNIEVCC